MLLPVLLCGRAGPYCTAPDVCAVSSPLRLLARNHELFVAGARSGCKRTANTAVRTKHFHKKVQGSRNYAAEPAAVVTCRALDRSQSIREKRTARQADAFTCTAAEREGTSEVG